MSVEIVCDDVLRWAETYTEVPFHSLLCDAPYELHMMNKSWDNTGIAFRPATWAALARHLLPGAFLMVFASTRGYHRLACALEDAGLIIHPSIFLWAFGSGWPKATRIPDERFEGHRYGRQALKPACEPLILAQKELNNCPVFDKLIEDSIFLLEGFLCQFIHAPTVENHLHVHSTMPNAALPNSVRASAFVLQYALSHDGTSGVMGMWQLPEAVSILSNIVLLWQNILGVLWNQERSSTTKIVSAMTTALKILNSWCCLNTPATIVQAVSYQNGTPYSVGTVGKSSSDLKSSLPHTPQPIAPENVLRNTKPEAGNGSASDAATTLRLPEQASLANDVIALLRVITAHAQFQLPSCAVLLSLAKSAESLITAIHSDLQASSTISAPSLVHAPGGISPIAVAQKPYEGAAVSSIVKHGAGALNIEGSRVGMSANDYAAYTAKRHSFEGITGNVYDGLMTSRQLSADEYIANTNGKRWPPNLCLVHLESCVPLGPRAVRGDARQGGGMGGMMRQADSTHQPVSAGYAAPDGTETVQAWDCSEGCPVRALDLQAGGEHRAGGKPGGPSSTTQTIYGDFAARSPVRHDDTGMVSRFYPQHSWAYEVAERLAGVMPAYYCGKASSHERNAGLEGMRGLRPPLFADGTIRRCSLHDAGVVSGGNTYSCGCPILYGAKTPVGGGRVRNPHPCVKPLSLCTWLAALLLPPAAYAPRRLLVPFAGTGSECIAGSHAGFEQVVGIEMSPEYAEMSRQRLAYWTGHRPAPGLPDAVLETPPMPGPSGEQLPLY